MVNSVVTWLVGILGTIAAIVIVYAGFKLVTSGGNSHAKEEAKELIQNMFIGYVIILAGWLLVDTGMKMLLTDGETALGMWNQVSCVDQARYTPAGYREPDPFDTTELTVEAVENNYVDPIMIIGAGGTGGAGGAYPPNLSAGGACSASLIQPFFGSQTGNAQCIIRAESACGANSVSRTDVMRVDGRAFSFGPMQINLTVHTLNGCAGYPPVLRCLDAFSGRNYSARVINESLYQQCARAAQNFACNIRNGARIYREAGNSWRPWSTAAGCGLR
jgi:hypothetical protein